MSSLEHAEAKLERVDRKRLSSQMLVEQRVESVEAEAEDELLASITGERHDWIVELLLTVSRNVERSELIPEGTNESWAKTAAESRETMVRVLSIVCVCRVFRISR